MTVPREYTVNDFAINDTFAQATPTTVAGSSTTTGSNTLLQGATMRTSTAFGRSATVKAGEDIRPALESLRSAGGGTLILLAGVHRPTYDIVGDTNINIIGEGRDITRLFFDGGAFGIKVIGTSGAYKENFCIESLSIESSGASGGLYLEYCKFFSCTNVKALLCTQNGVSIVDSMYFTLDKFYINNCTGQGLYMEGGAALGVVRNFDILNSEFSFNSGNGISMFSNGSSDVFYGSLINVRTIGNDLAGVLFDATVVSAFSVSLIGCLSGSNGGNAFTVSSGCQRIFFTNCIAQSNTGNGFDINGSDCTILGGYTSDAMALNANCTVLGVYNTDTTTFGANAFASEVRTRDDCPKESRRTIASVNKSGGTLTKGAVVVWGTSVNGDEYTTSTTVGDDRVLGVVNAVTANNYWGYVLVEGFTGSLKVNGTTDIAVGDFLGTYSVAGIAAKAVAGDMAFAIALEAYTTNDSNGVIDALIISPRKL